MILSNVPTELSGHTVSSDVSGRLRAVGVPGVVVPGESNGRSVGEKSTNNYQIGAPFFPPTPYWLWGNKEVILFGDGQEIDQ